MAKIRSFKRLQEQAYDYLKEMIISEKLEDGEIYSETKTAEEIGISRTPIRDALQRLSQEGLIDIIPSKGFKIREISEVDIIEIFQIRAAIEGFCSLLMAKEYDTPKAQDTIKQLEALINRQKEIADSDSDIHAFVEADQRFHITIVNYADNSEFNKLFNHYMYRIKKLAIHSLKHPGRIQSTIQEHINIFHAISTGNVSEVFAITLIHMETPKYINLEDFYNHQNTDIFNKK